MSKLIRSSPAAPWNRPAKVKMALAGIAALIATGGAMIVGCSSYISIASMTALRRTETNAVIEALAIAGLDAKSLAAAGVEPAAVEDIVTAVRDHLNEHPFSQTHAAFTSALAEVERLTGAVQSGGGEQSATALTTARATLETASAAHSAAVAGITSAASAHLSEAQRTAIANFRANRELDIPAKYLTAARSESEWLALRGALASVRISTARNESPNPQAAAAIADANAHEATVTAAQGMQRVGEVRAAWLAAVGPI